MSLSKERSRDKAEWVKWPHVETHWQPQHYETPHRAIKKADNSKSHSWWWDSHISPKSSKWLQENLAEMDSKVNAMLKIIEEDADSFAKRAEMYYKRRPELVMLVEEFYRTYRALVERHTFLTKELRQNIAPALQAQLGASYESSNSPSDLLVKHGSDGFDLASLSSYSYPGALEFDDDSQSDFSTKSSKGRVDEEDASPLESRVSFETREFEFKPWTSSAEEEHLPTHHQNRELHGAVDASSSHELRKTLQTLEDQNKALTVKSGEDDLKLQDLLHEVSTLLLLKQDLLQSQKLKEALELESSSMMSKIQELQRELETTRRNNQEFLEQIKQRDGQMSKLEETIGNVQLHRTRLEAEKDEMLKHVLGLEKELQKARDSFLAEAQHRESQCKALEAAEAQLEEQLASLLNKNKWLHEEKVALEGMLAKAHSEVKELHYSSSTLFSEKSLLLQMASGEADVCQTEKDTLLQESELQTTHFRDLEVALSRLLREKNMQKNREAKALHSFSELEKASQAECAKSKQTVDEHLARIAELDISLANLIKERDLLDKQGREARADVERHLSEIQKLQNEVIAKVELIFKLENVVASQSMGLTKLEEKIVLLGNDKEKDIKTMAEYGSKIHDLEARVAESLALQTALKEQVAQKSEDVKSLEAELVDVHKEKETLSDEFVVSSGHAILLQKQLDKCKEFEDAQNVDLEKHADRIQSMEMEVVSLQLSLSEAVERNNALICEQQESLDEITRMRRRLQDFEEQVSHLTEDKVLLVKGYDEQKGKMQMQLQNSNDMIRSLEQELLKLHKAVSTAEEGNSIPVCEQSRSLDASLKMPDTIKHIHHKVGSLLEERVLLLSKASSHKEQRIEMELRLQSLERDKDAVHKELLQAMTLLKHVKGDMQNLKGEKEQLVMLSSSEEGENLCKEIRALQEELKKNQQVVSEAKRNTEKLEGDLSRLILANAVVEKELSTKIMELSTAQEDACKVRTRKYLLEDEAQEHLHQIKSLNEVVEKLQQQLQDAQQEIEGLGEHLAQLSIKYSDAQKATHEAKEEINKQVADGDSLKKEMDVLLTTISKLEQDLASVEDEKNTLLFNMEALQLEMKGVQSEREYLKSKSSQLEEKELDIKSLQEQLKAAESHRVSLAETFSEAKNQWVVEQERVQEELAQLKVSNMEGQKNLAIQLDRVSKLKEELSGLHGERSLLQEDRELGAKTLADTQREAAEQLNQIEGARKREHEKDRELLELLALAETLKQSLSVRDVENSRLVEDLRKSAECQSAAEKRSMEEICFLQSEEMKWRNEVTANSALMAEKVASLRMENAALHEDLSLKIELALKLQKDVESLTEENTSLSQAVQAMAAEMQDLRNEHYIIKDIVIPSLEERVNELQDETTDLTVSNEKHVAEIINLKEELKDSTSELRRLHDKNAIFEIELMFNVEMLKHVDGAHATAKAEILQFFDMQEKHSQMLEQMLTKATDENEDLSRRFLSVAEERNGLKTEVQCLFAILVEVEQLQRELAVAREDNPSVRGTEFAGAGSLLNLQTSLPNSVRGSGEAEESIDVLPIQNIRGGPEHAQESVNVEMRQIEPQVEDRKSEFSIESQQQMEGSPLNISGSQDVVTCDGSDSGAARGGSNGKVEASVCSHAHLIGRLKGEIYFLQEKIQRLELATSAHGSGFASNEVDAKDFVSGAHEDMPSPRKNSTASSSSILTVEEAVPGGLDDVIRLKEVNRNLVEENDSLKSQSLAAWMENNLIENSVRDLQANRARLQEKNEQLSSELNSCKAGIDRLEGECHSLQGKNLALQQDVEASIQEKRKSEETLCMLEDVITSLERGNRRLQAENEVTSEELKNLHGTLSCLHDEGTELIALLKMKMVSTVEEVKLIMDDCRKEMGDEDIVQLLMNIEHVCSSRHEHVNASLPEDKQGWAIESTNERRVQETMPELVARNTLILTELQARAEEANILLEVVVFIRRMLISFLCGEHTCQRDTPLSTGDEILKREEAFEVAERTPPLVYDEDLDLVGSAQHHIKLAERLHQAFVDEKLEHELLELKDGRKQLKEELEVRLEEVQRMELELEKLQGLLEDEGGSKREGVKREEWKKETNKEAVENMKELRETLAQRRRQICRMQEEVMFGEEQQEAAAENQVTVLVSMESAPSMEGVDDEQVNLLSREFESLRTLNRRHSAELQTISQDLQSMGSIIKSAQDQLLIGSSQHGEEEIISIADLRTQKSSIVDLRTQNSRVSVDSTQQLLSPSPRLGVVGDSVAAHRSSSNGSFGQFHLKPRNFGFTWFLLLFSPDRKALNLARSKSNKPWAALNPMRRTSSGSAALVVERGRRKAGGCWACMSNTSRLDSFDHR